MRPFGDLGRAVRIGLAVAHDDLERMLGSTDVDLTVGEGFDLIDRPRQLLREDRKWPGDRGHKPDLHASRRGEGDTRQSGRGDRRDAGLEERTAPHVETCHSNLPDSYY
jgi:hypothetical protein